MSAACFVGHCRTLHTGTRITIRDVATKTDRRSTRTPWRGVFLDNLAEGATVRAAAQQAGVARSTVYAHRAADAEFAEAWDDAYEAGNDQLEDEAHRRAVEGVDEPVFHRGEIVGHVTKYSDQLLMFLLRGRRPDRYGTSRSRVEVSAPTLTGGELEAIRQAGADPDLAAALDKIAEALGEAARGTSPPDEGP